MLLIVGFMSWVVYWWLPSELRWYWLCACCVFIILYFAPVALGVLSVMLLCTYFGRSYPKVLIGFLIGNLLFWKVWADQSLLGLSFVTFFLIHYVVDFQRYKLPSHSLVELSTRVFFLPILSAGPIERLQHFLEGQQKRPLWEKAGIRLTLGILQKWVLGEGIVSLFLNGWSGELLVEHGMTLSTLSLWGVFGGLFVQLYCDFAGYSNMAIGISALFGFEIADNFRSPLLARNPAEFWKRWHISLSAWCQEYIYLPILGLTRNPYLAILGTFLVMGLWHAVSWHWVLWGVCHAFALIIHLRWRRMGRLRTFRETAFWKAFSWILLMVFLALTSSLTQVYGHGSIDTSLSLIALAIGIH